MKKIENQREIFRVKSLITVAFLFLLIVLSGQFTATQAQGGSWRLKDIRGFNNMDGNFGTIVNERYDASGGSVDIQLKGDILSFCPGGYEKIRFTWNFADNIREVSSGGGISTNMDARQIAKSQNCGTQIASRSYMFVYPGSFVFEGSGDFDRGRFVAADNFRALAADGVQSGIGGLKVSTYAFDPKRPLAYFEVCMVTPTRSGGGYVCYAYPYENGSSTGGNGGAAGNLNVEYNTDRMGGDYTNFDLERDDFELCRTACARDSKCKAYTYVKPGVQSSSARCWLKSSVPAGKSDGCCISGTRVQGMAFVENRLLKTLLTYKPVSLFSDSE